MRFHQRESCRTLAFVIGAESSTKLTNAAYFPQRDAGTQYRNLAFIRAFPPCRTVANRPFDVRKRCVRLNNNNKGVARKRDIVSKKISKFRMSFGIKENVVHMEQHICHQGQARACPSKSDRLEMHRVIGAWFCEHLPLPVVS